MKTAEELIYEIEQLHLKKLNATSKVSMPTKYSYEQDVESHRIAKEQQLLLMESYAKEQYEIGFKDGKEIQKGWDSLRDSGLDKPLTIDFNEGMDNQ